MELWILQDNYFHKETKMLVKQPLAITITPTLQSKNLSWMALIRFLPGKNISRIIPIRNLKQNISRIIPIRNPRQKHKSDNIN